MSAALQEPGERACSADVRAVGRYVGHAKARLPLARRRGRRRRETLDDRAVGAIVTVAIVGQVAQRLAHRLQGSCFLIEGLYVL